MKKKFFFLAALVIASLTASASVEIIGGCGKSMITVDEEYFDSEEDADAFYQEMAKELCGDGYGDGYSKRYN